MATSSMRGKTDPMHEDLTKAILSQIREDELIAMCSDVVNIPSATGEELEMGRYMRGARECAGDLGRHGQWQKPDVQRPHGYFEHRARRILNRDRVQTESHHQKRA